MKRIGQRSVAKVSLCKFMQAGYITAYGEFQQTNRQYLLVIIYAQRYLLPHGLGMLKAMLMNFSILMSIHDHVVVYTHHSHDLEE